MLHPPLGREVRYADDMARGRAHPCRTRESGYISSAYWKGIRRLVHSGRRHNLSHVGDYECQPLHTLTGIAFTDTLPSGLVFASPGNLSSTCGGVTIASLGTNTLSLSGGVLAAEATCSVSVNVTPITAGTITNSVTVTSTNGGTGNTAEATIVVPVNPIMVKSFGVASVHLNGSTSLTFTITNANSSTSLTGIAFTDTLPSGLVFASPGNLSSTCGGVTIASLGTNTLSLSGGVLAAEATCSVSVNVKATSTGKKINSVTVTSANAGTGIASAVISVTLSNSHDFNGDGKSDIAWRDTQRRRGVLADERRPRFRRRAASAGCPAPGRSSASATSTATAWPTCCGTTPAAMSRCGS